MTDKLNKQQQALADLLLTQPAKPGQRARHRFDRQGELAIRPEAFFELFFEDEREEELFTMHGDVAVVSIEGPLDHHAGWWCDSYDEIYKRMEAAFASNARSVVMCLDSPGGVVSGCFSTVRAIRDLATRSKKPLVGYVDGQACSAGYALLATCDYISCSESSIIGSIGVIQTRVDYSQMLSADGIKVEFITSGARKADGHPTKLFTEDERSALQETINDLAQIFFDWTAERRVGLDAKSLEAGVFVGATAKKHKLVDEITSFDRLLANLAGGGMDDMSKYTDARSALEEAAQEEGDEAAKAQKVVQFMDTLESDDDETDEESSDESAEDESDDESAEDESDDEKAAAKASKDPLAAMAATVQRLEAENKKLRGKSAKDEREQLFAARPDVGAAVKAGLANASVEQIKAALAAIPAPVKKTAKKPIEQPTSKHRGAGQVNTPGAPIGTVQNSLSARMGLGPKSTATVKHTPHKMTFGAAPAEEGTN